MAVFQIEDGVATGRGFAGIDADGICSKFYDWITTAPASGGPGWYIIDDYSDNVAINFATTDVDTGTDRITLTAHGFSHGHTVRFSTTTTAPSPLANNTTYYVIYIDANTIQLATTFNNAIAGTAINLTTQGAGTHTITPMEYFIVVSDVNGAAANAYNTGTSGGAPKYIRFGYYVSNAGYVSMHGLLYWDTTLRMGRGYWTGRELTTYDAADFVYSFRGGDEQMMIATRTGTTWNYMIIDDFVGDTNLLEAPTNVGVLQGSVTSGSSVVCQLDTGEAANFTVNNYYYIYDFTATTVGTAATQINYIRITAVDTINDTVTIETLTDNFNAGAVISPYAHRFYSIGFSRVVFTYVPTGISCDETSSGMNYIRIPYYSSTVGQICYRLQNSGASNTERAISSWLSTVITGMAPDDRGYYAAQRPIIVESSNPNGSANRAYGILKNLYTSSPGSALAWSDYRVIGSRQWLYIGQNNFHVFTLNTESLT